MLSSRYLRCSTSCIGVVGAPAIGAVEEAWPICFALDDWGCLLRTSASWSRVRVAVGSCS